MSKLLFYLKMNAERLCNNTIEDLTYKEYKKKRIKIKYQSLVNLTTLAGVLVVNLVLAIFPLIHLPLNVVPLDLMICPLPC